jgi:hypothetical protein
LRWLVNRRPLPVTIIAWLFIVAGTIGLAYHLTDQSGSPDIERVLVLVIRILAIAGGIFLLRGAGWARWVLLAWVAYHVVLSFLHSVSEIIMHTLLLLIVAFFLTRPNVTAWFRTTEKTPS